MRLSAASVLAPRRGRLARRPRASAVVFASLSLLLLTVACDPFSSQPSSETITIAAVPGIENANLYLAQHGGYFRRAGVTVKIEKYTSVSAEIAALNSGAVDAIAADYGDMFYSESVAPQHPVYQVMADGYDAAPGVIEILTMPNSKIKSPDQLAGLHIPAPNSEKVRSPAGDPNTLALASAASVLQSDGVNLAAVTWEGMSPSQELYELVHRQAQAILATGINIYLAQQAGAVELIDGCSGPTAGIPLDGFFVRNAWLGKGETSNSAAATAFQTAIYNADAAASMPGPIQAVLPAWDQLSTQEADLVTTGTYPLSTITGSLQRTASLMDNEGMTKINVNVAQMVFH